MMKVVNMIPLSLSGETNQDSEPNIAVNPANPLQIAASAFTPNPMGGSSANAPIFVSIDGGDTWTLNNIVPSAGSLGTGDITLKFAGTSSRLFTTILDGTSSAFEVHRTTTFTSTTPMTQLETRGNEDQPFVQATTVMGGADVGKDRVYIGVNDFNAPGGRTATVEQTLDAGLTLPTFNSIRVEKRTTLGQNGPQVRPAVHLDGTVYAAFYRWISSSGSFPANTLVITNAEAVVVRDDNWGLSATPFTALTDPSDSLAGRRAAIGLSFPFNQTGVAANGQERWGGDIAIAVDPRNSSTVYLAFSTLVSGVYTLRIVRSLDRGATWSGTLLSVSNAKNASLAINSLGKIGFVCQQLSGTGATQRWETHFRDSTDGTTWTDTTLCSALSQSPTRVFSPYMGDYIHMMAVGKDFFGIFSASNTPNLANFPQGVTYQRNHDFATQRLFALDGVTVVNPSIDPFFFKVTELDSPATSDFYVRDWTDSAATHDTGLEPSTKPVFYTTSDVWNQRANVAPTFVSDQPQNEDPQNNATNFAFARISRNATGSAATVNVDFLVAEFGTGSPYQLVATTTVAFAAGDSVKVVSAPWTLGPTSSTHLCLGVQVSTAADPFVLPGLNGNTPGWPTTDLIVINDNNKAQRNMTVHYGLAKSGTSHFALIRNGSAKRRDVAVRVNVAGDVQKLLVRPTVQFEKGGEPGVLKSGSVLTLKAMQPGEYRWVALAVRGFAADTRALLPVDLLEVVDGKVVNGFRMSIVSATTPKALRELLLLNTATFQRLASLFKSTAARDVVAASQRLAKTKLITNAAYLQFLTEIREGISKAVTAFLTTRANDRGLAIASSLKLLLAAIDAGDFTNAFGHHTTLLNKLDVALTLFQKAAQKTSRVSKQPTAKR